MNSTKTLTDLLNVSEKYDINTILLIVILSINIILFIVKFPKMGISGLFTRFCNANVNAPQMQQQQQQQQQVFTQLPQREYNNYPPQFTPSPTPMQQIV
jgi:hypothetical protein